MSDVRWEPLRDITPLFAVIFDASVPVDEDDVPAPQPPGLPIIVPLDTPKPG